MAIDGLIVAIDPFPVGRMGFSAQRLIAKTGVERVRRGAVRWERATGKATGAKYRSTGERPFDFVFIDGDHSYDGLRDDWLEWRHLIAPDGIVALHDSRSSPDRAIDGAGSVVFTREVILNDQAFRTIEAIDTLTVLQRTG